MSRQPVDPAMRFECNCKICLNYRELPTKILVKNAIVQEVNGEYYRVDWPEDSIVYAKNGIWNKDNHCFCINSLPQRDGTIDWKIRGVIKKREGSIAVDRSRELYHGPASKMNEPPPKIGWKIPGQHTICSLELSYNFSDNMNANINEESRIVPFLNDGLLYSRARRLEQNKPKLQKITHQADQDKIYASMFRFLFSNPCDYGTARKRVEQNLQTAFLKERYTVLELIVWKALCRMHYPFNIDIYTDS